MLSMVNSAGTYGNSFVSATFMCGEMGSVQFAVDNLTAGTVTFQGRVPTSDDSGTWQSLDTAELVFTTATDDFKAARLGGIEVRSIGDGTAAVTGVYIAGPYVRKFSDG
jgi:hypothetical protein